MRKLTIFALSGLSATPAFAASGPFLSLGNTDFVVLLGFILFGVVLVYFKVPGILGGLLDKRAEGIKSELDEARALREEAQALLASYDRKQREMQELTALTGWKSSKFNWYLGQGEEPAKVTIPDADVTPEELLGTVPVDLDGGQRVKGADLEIATDDFLAVARKEAGVPQSNQGLLFSIAMRVFACGVLDRIVGGERKAKKG